MNLCDPQPAQNEIDPLGVKSMPQSPELAGGDGFTFEGAVAASYLACLLAEAYAPGIENLRVSGVSVQQRDFGEPLDDVIVDFVDSMGGVARLSLQVKRSLTISQAKTNKDFRDIVRDSWLTLKGPKFREGIDRFGAAVGEIAKDKRRTLITLCEFARESLTLDHFLARFASMGNASKDTQVVKDDITALIREVLGENPTDLDIYKFLGHFVLIEFDFLHAGAGGPPVAITQVRNCLTQDDAGKAPLVWSRLIEIARASAGRAGQFDRPRLVRSISRLARLKIAPSFENDLEKLKILAQGFVNSIHDDVGGTRLERKSIYANLNSELSSARIVQIRGLPGSGKSVLLRQSVQEALNSGPVLFLKADQLEGRSWLNFASLYGLSSVSLVNLLVEIGSAGCAVFYVDGIDRLEKEHRPIVLDILRAIIGSPHLESWRVVFSLRDSGIEPLRNWMDELLIAFGVATITVGSLEDEEAEILALEKPHLRSLLFGSSQVREIVRRPFFAKVLNQSFAATPGNAHFEPQSEVDLISNWWLRGGYNATGQDALNSQRAILNLASLRARRLGEPIRIGDLLPSSMMVVHQLIDDGILQTIRPGHSVQFAHDIFFEWAFLQVLIDIGENWLEEVQACGEPPAIARVVELLSQFEYARATDWISFLKRAAISTMRPQWTRAWLLGPLGASNFNTQASLFSEAVFSDNLHFLKKTLVWFQAEKTTPNPTLLLRDLPIDTRLRLADLYGWPSDFPTWRRLIEFLLNHISVIPARLYPETLAVFEVWQNAVGDIKNLLSTSILEKCAEWLRDLDASDSASNPDANTRRWETVSNLKAFRESLAGLVLRASVRNPALSQEYLNRLILNPNVSESRFKETVAYSFSLARSHPSSLVDLTLAQLKKELPEDEVKRERGDALRVAEHVKQVRAKPEGERTPRDNLVFSGLMSSIGYRHFSYHDWEALSIHTAHHGFWPMSPLREPFHSLFQSEPSEAIRLVNDLSHHAMTAWRQLHVHDRERAREPIPLSVQFPWGQQFFWGSDREYLWCRGVRAPKALACGFLALEEWSLAELDRGRSIDEIIQQIVQGNDCIAILGVAVAMALHTESISEAVFALVTSNRLLHADENRMFQEHSLSSSSLMGFDGHSDENHISALRNSNARAIRKKCLAQLLPLYILGGEPFAKRTSERLLDFKNCLPFQYEQDQTNEAVQQSLSRQAMEFEALAHRQNYRVYKTDDPSKVAIQHVKPSASDPEIVARANEANLFLRIHNLWAWASEALDSGALGAMFTVASAIALAKEADSASLFDEAALREDLEIKQGAVAATAAVALHFRQDCSFADLVWSRDIHQRALKAPEKSNGLSVPGSLIPWHPLIFVVKGLASDLREGTWDEDSAYSLLSLIAHPLEIVSLAAIQESCRLFSSQPKITWTALRFAFSLCNVQPRPPGEYEDPTEPIHTVKEIQSALDQLEIFYRSDPDWSSIPVPAPAWLKLDVAQVLGRRTRHQGYEEHDLESPEDVWVEPATYWHSQYAAKILPLIPLPEVLNCPGRDVFLVFLSTLLHWTNEKNAPPWVKIGRRTHPSTMHLEWTRSLGSALGLIAGQMQIGEIQARFLDPITALEGDSCWAVLAPFADTYIRAYVFDADRVPDNLLSVIGLCLDRLLVSKEFNRSSYRAGEFYGFDQPELLKTLMFVTVERADQASRFVNGDWSEIKLVLPVVDRLVRAGGWSVAVMHSFLTLCERAKSTYPAELFADQILTTIDDDAVVLESWQGTVLPARIAALVQHLTERDSPMQSRLAQKFLRILDRLVDIGDRRSAALQLSETFREVRVSG